MRIVPSFGLFRRTSSVVSDPTAQGVNLRGIGPSLRLAGRHAITGGGDLRRITAGVAEDLFPPPPTDSSVVRREVDAEQRLGCAFLQDVWEVTDALALSLALRWDGWDARASRSERLGDGSVRPARFPRRGDEVLSPKLGLRVRPLDGLVLRASAYRAFRAPTLNELYRPFQVGPIQTEANQDLGPETLRGAEAGLEIAAPLGATARVTGFWNELDGAITNVTTGTNLRRRQNLGRARIRGIEAEAGWRFAGARLGTVAYTLAESEVTRAPGQPRLVGKALQQDPVHRASASLGFHDPRVLSAALQARFIGRQYEDDQNTLPMKAVFLVDLSASRRIAGRVELFVAVENVLDEEYLVGRAGVDTVGQPRFVHGGVHVRFGG